MSSPEKREAMAASRSQATSQSPRLAENIAESPPTTLDSYERYSDEAFDENEEDGDDVNDGGIREVDSMTEKTVPEEVTK